MNKAMLNSLTEAERLLVDETMPDALAGLDEDALLELHQRIRRARTKYVKLYRRGAGAAVRKRGGRGISYPANQRARDKAEIFESALARVSRRVGVAARQASAELRAERIKAARAGRGTGPAGAAEVPSGQAPAESGRRRAVKTTGGLKKDASTRATGARRQAIRDSR
jgi:hypothetical protein